MSLPFSHEVAVRRTKSEVNLFCESFGNKYSFFAWELNIYRLRIQMPTLPCNAPPSLIFTLMLDLPVDFSLLIPTRLVHLS